LLYYSAQEDLKPSPGAVESVIEHPGHPGQYLIGFSRGLVVLWNTSTNLPEQTYNASTVSKSIIGSKYIFKNVASFNGLTIKTRSIAFWVSNIKNDGNLD